MSSETEASDPSVRVGILAAQRPKAFRRGHLPSEAGEGHETARRLFLPSEAGEDDQKNTRLLTSMLSRGGAPLASGFSNEVWKESRARPSLALSWMRISSASSGCMSEK